MSGSDDGHDHEDDHGHHHDHHGHHHDHEDDDEEASTGFLPISLALTLFVTGLFVLGIFKCSS